MQSCPDLGDRINSYALVSYVPGALGEYLDRMRVELVSACVAQSHVTVLPPRDLKISQSSAQLELEQELSEFPPFDVSLADVDVFRSTTVIYLAIGTGAAELRQLHGRTNRNGLAFAEEFEYHPHVTLAQKFPIVELEAKFELAARRWREWRHGRSFRIDHLTFVQNTTQDRWQDIADISLGDAVLAGVWR
jgi:2'-5' RNA ligase